MWIHQDAWFHWLKLDQGVQKTYTLKGAGNGVYVFVIKGSAQVAEHDLHARDGLGISEVEQFELRASADAELLLMEVPMSV